ncbi:methyl-accepting chemotaxis sensory transducer [Candidatus Magnetomorum sp. HK-1]|nr:methyl-accepting chemotaxis sensory transducer [Candidatus Magnetomorum sp. HK-1]
MNSISISNLGIQTKTIVLVIIITSIVLIAFGAFDYIQIQTQMTTDLEESADIIANRLSKTLVDPLWDMEMDKIDNIMKAEMAEKRIYAVIVKESNSDVVSTGRIRDENWEITETKKIVEGDRYIRCVKKLVKEKDVLGTVEVINTPKFMQKALFKALILVIVKMITQNILLIIALFLIIRKIIILPLIAVIKGLNESSKKIDRATGMVSNSSAQLSTSTSSQAAYVQETSSALEELTAMSQQNSENASEANIFIKKSNEVVSRSNESMIRVKDSMNDISNASTETQKIIKNIDEVAFQTNLLALNAAVEAARAGEAGAGFAVVADEVRNLAMRSAEAARNTASLIESTVKKVNEGSELVQSTYDDFSGVVEAVAKTEGLIGEISNANKEQFIGIEEINKALTEIDTITQQIAMVSSETAEASEDLAALSTNMSTYVNSLSSMVSGAKAAEERYAKTHNERYYDELPDEYQNNGVKQLTY